MIYFIGNSQDGLIRIGHSKRSIATALRELQRDSLDELILQAHLSEMGPRARDELWRLFAADRVSGWWFRSSARLSGLIDWAVDHEHASAVEMWRFLGVPGVVDSLPRRRPKDDEIDPRGWEEHWLKHEAKRERTAGQIARAQRRGRKGWATIERRRRHAS